jgi:hypothetical protein
MIVIFFCIATQLGLSQIRLEFTAHQEDKNDGKKTTFWAKGCDARMEDVGDKEKMYMLVKDCGKTTIAVSEEEKAAVKMPPMMSSPAPDINTGALFMQGKPQITVEKLEEKPGPSILGRATTYYRFKSVHRPDARIQEPVKLIVEEEFWTDPTLDMPVLDSMLGKAPVGDAHESERTAFAIMKGLPLRHRTIVTIERAGARQAQPAFIQEVLSISKEPFDESLLQVPKGFQLVDMASAQQ